MSRNLALLCLPLVAVCLLRQQEAASVQETASEKVLPGSRPQIEAIRFPSLQAAIDALPESGGIVQLPPGDFAISKPLVISQEDVLLRGSGTATHIRNTNTDGQPSILIKATWPDEPKRRQWRVELSDFRLTGNPRSGHGIEAVRVNEILVDRISVTEHGGDGIRLDNCLEDARVSASLVTYNKQVGLNLIGCHDIVVSACQFEENQDALHCTDGFNLCMTGNCLDDHLGHGVVIENTYGSVVAGNMIEECQATALILDRDCYGITLSANVIAHNGAGFDLRDAHGCTVSANTFTIMKTDAVRIGPDSGRIAVTGNNFSNSYIGSAVKRRPEDRAAAGLVLDATRDITVSGNLFAGVAPRGVELRGRPVERVVFSANLLRDAETDHRDLVDSAIHTNLLSRSAPEDND